MNKLNEIDDITFFLEPTVVKPNDGLINTFFLVPKIEGKGLVNFEARSYGIPLDSFKYSVSQLTGLLLHLYSSFPVVEDDNRLFDSLTPEKQNELVDKYSDRIAIQTHRGSANIRYKNIIMYWGSSLIDRPFQILQDSISEKYCLVRHPDIQDFAYRLF